MRSESNTRLVVDGRRARVRHRVASGELERILPGIYVPVGARDVVTRAWAVSMAHPDAVVAGRAAAALTWWPELDVHDVDVVIKRRVAKAPGYRWLRASAPPELVIVSHGVRITAPALTVLDLIPGLGPQAIDEALRRGVTTLDKLRAALAATPNRRGNVERARLLRDSTDEPWSAAERRFHELYRDLRLPWHYSTNYRIPLLAGSAFADLALPQLKLAFEVDGREFHTSRRAFERDRTRDPELIELGWQVVRFAATTVFNEPHWVADRVRRIVAARAVERRAFG